MANKTFAIHTSEEIIERVDRHAERMRRSRNSLFNEAIEILLEILDTEQMKTIRAIKAEAKKAGK